MTLTDRDYRIVEDYNNNQKIADIANKHGVSKQAVLAAIRAARPTGIVTRAPRAHQASGGGTERDSKMVNMYKSGMTLTAIGNEFGITRERVRQILSAYGIGRRNPAERADMKRSEAMEKYGDLIDSTFDELLSIPRVIEAMKDKNIPTRWIRQRLAHRTHESLRAPSMKRTWSNDDIIGVLKEAALDKGTVTIPSYQKWRETVMFNGKRPPTHSIISWRFGSWSNALQSAGLSTRPAYRTYKRRWTKDDAIDAVGRYVKETERAGNRPTFGGYDIWSRSDKSVPSGAYVRLLTNMSWSQIMRELNKKATF